MKKIKEMPPRKGQLCYRCGKEIEKDWIYNGNWWHEECKSKDNASTVRNYLKEYLKKKG